MNDELEAAQYIIDNLERLPHDALDGWLRWADGGFQNTTIEGAASILKTYF